MSVRLAALILAAAGVPAGFAESQVDAPLYRQVSKGCGAASLGMVVDYWAERTSGLNPDSPRALQARLLDGDSEGIPLSAMKSYLVGRGFHAFTIRADLDELARQLGKGRPLIVPIRTGGRLHYTVVTGIDAERIRLNDPARKKPRRMKRGRFDRKWAAADRWMLLAVPRQESQ